MPKVREIADYLENKVPSRFKMDFDNVGLLAGFSETEVRRVLVALDITGDVIAEAAEIKAELIVSHHPLILGALKSIVDTDLTGRRVTALLRSGISAICLHTNLDIVCGGVNDALAASVGAKAVGVVEVTGEDPDGAACGLGRLCQLPEPLPLAEFLERVSASLQVSGLRYFDSGKPVKRLAVCGGSGGDLVHTAFEQGCDTYLTGEIRYHNWLEGRELGLNLIEADHFCTENVVVPVLRDMLLEGFPELDVRISRVHAQTSRGF